MIYPYIAGLIAVIGIILAIIRFKESQISITMFIFWLMAWFSVIIISFFPQETSFLANLIGIGRGLDLVLILGLLGSYYLIFKIYTMIEGLKSDISDLVQEISLKHEKIERILEEKK